MGILLCRHCMGILLCRHCMGILLCRHCMGILLCRHAVFTVVTQETNNANAHVLDSNMFYIGVCSLSSDNS